MKKIFLSLIAFTICAGAYATYSVSEQTFQLSKDDAGITVTPSNNDPWDWYIIADTTFERLGADSINTPSTYIKKCSEKHFFFTFEGLMLFKPSQTTVPQRREG